MIINSPENGAIGQLIIESLTIGNITRGNLIVENLKLTPGVKYNLELTFYVPPTQEVLDPSNDHTLNTTSKVVTVINMLNTL